MEKQLLIIGGDSFVAGKFIIYARDKYSLRIVSRKHTDYKDEIILGDFFELSSDIFREIDVVINFAAIVHQPKLKDEKLYESINYKLPLFIANLCLINNVKHFIQISTISVYGNAYKINSETPVLPNDLYGKYKLMADIALSELAQKTDLNISILRPSMIYGGGAAPGNFLKLIKLVKMRIPLPFKGIKNSRQFLNVHNFNVLLNYVIKTGRAGTIIIADPESISTPELLKAIGSAVKIPVLLFNLPGFWRIVSIFNRNIVDKLTQDLIIENTIPNNEITNDKTHSLYQGIIEMI